MPRLSSLGLLLALTALPAAASPPPAPATAPPMAAAALSPSQACRAAIATAEREAGIPEGLLQAIGRVESGRRDPVTGGFGPWPWTINAEGRGHFFPDRAAAIAAVQELQGRGVRLIDVGCMQVNLRHHPDAFPNLQQAFDPMANARYAARFLTALHAEAGGREEDWMVAAGRYHSRTPDLGAAYRARVAAAWPAARARGPEDQALAARATAPRPPPVPALSNGAERARIIAGPNPAGRGLAAYRAHPVPLAARHLMPRRR